MITTTSPNEVRDNTLPIDNKVELTALLKELEGKIDTERFTEKLTADNFADLFIRLAKLVSANEALKIIHHAIREKTRTVHINKGYAELYPGEMNDSINMAIQKLDANLLIRFAQEVIDTSGKKNPTEIEKLRAQAAEASFNCASL